MNIVLSKSISISPKRKRMIIRELVQGQEAATQLKLLLQNPFKDGGSLSAKELVGNMLRSFTHSLSFLTPDDDEPFGYDEVAHRDLLSSGDNGSPVVVPGNDIPKSDEDSNESWMRSLVVKKNGRGCYKRRKTAQTWTTVSHTIDDNRAWRKYGQKAILNYKFPRSYFRCSRKHDEGCRATKQVQRTQENPSMYEITYIGIHTCIGSTLKAPHLVMDTGTWESYIMNSHPVNSSIHKEHDHPISLPSLKQEYPKKDTPSDVTDHKLDPSQLSDLKDFEPSKPDNADTVHSYTGSQSLEHKLDPSQWSDLKDFEPSKPDNADTVHSYTGSQSLEHKLDPSQWSDLKDFEPSKPDNADTVHSYTGSQSLEHKLDPSQWSDFEPSKPDNADTVHSYTGSQSLDIDFVVDSVHFRSDFPFDGSHLL